MYYCRTPPSSEFIFLATSLHLSLSQYQSPGAVDMATIARTDKWKFTPRFHSHIRPPCTHLAFFNSENPEKDRSSVRHDADILPIFFLFLQIEYKYVLQVKSSTVNVRAHTRVQYAYRAMKNETSIPMYQGLCEFVCAHWMMMMAMVMVARIFFKLFLLYRTIWNGKWCSHVSVVMVNERVKKRHNKYEVLRAPRLADSERPSREQKKNNNTKFDVEWKWKTLKTPCHLFVRSFSFSVSILMHTYTLHR